MGQDRKRPKGADTIDANLRRVYLDALNEAVPDRFVALLDQLRAQDAAAGAATRAQTESAQTESAHTESPKTESTQTASTRKTSPQTKAAPDAPSPELTPENPASAKSAGRNRK